VKVTERNAYRFTNGKTQSEIDNSQKKRVGSLLFVVLLSGLSVTVCSCRSYMSRATEQAADVHIQKSSQSSGFYDFDKSQ